MVERFASAGGELFALLSNGRLYSASAARLNWRPMLEAVVGVTALALGA